MLGDIISIIRRLLKISLLWTEVLALWIYVQIMKLHDFIIKYV